MNEPKQCICNLFVIKQTRCTNFSNLRVFLE